MDESMTPTARAKAVRDEMEAQLGTSLGDSGWVELIASAIRAAEDDALERVARRVADETGWSLDARWVADLIRYFKSKETNR